MKLTNVSVDKLNVTSIDAVFPEYIPGNTKICYIAYATKVFQVLWSSPPFSDQTGPREYSDPGHRPEIPIISPRWRSYHSGSCQGEGADVPSPLEYYCREISRYSELQIVGAAWQNALLQKNSPGPSIVREQREVDMVAGAEIKWWRWNWSTVSWILGWVHGYIVFNFECQ